METTLVRFEVSRFRPEEEDEPTFQTYEVPCMPDWVVRDALNAIKDDIDPPLSHRWSCRMGVCGSCSMLVNGRPTLTCNAFIRNYEGSGPIRVEPLSNFPVVRDLVVELESFMTKLQSVKPWIIRKVEKDLGEGEYLQSPAQLEEFKQYSMCINCCLCYAACPVLANEPDFVGPAAIALAHRYNLDSRDEGNAERYDAIHGHDGVWACSYANECSQVCPKHVDPAMAINQAKLTGALQWFKILPKRSFT
ncbi:MAG: succinate dehydrogenase iron-sulfur subunit [bacterium]|nr:succinate dehydrogenase iron-sulfur subunit [bacterium]